ncbi:MAG: ATP-binding protein, partial [Anaerolineales bacterium]
ALRGVSFQSYSLEPENEGEAARLTFVVAVEGNAGQAGVIIGRTNLDQNPFFIPSLDILESLSEIGGVAMLVDEEGMVLYHPDSALIGTFYVGEIDLRNPLYDIRHTASDGTREILYVQPVPGRSWAIITTMPTEVTQEFTLESTLRLSIMLILLLAIVFSVLRIAIRPVIRSIGDLAEQATMVADGELDQSLESERVDEVGKLANAAEKMRLSLRARMEEVERLLQVSKGVASSLEMDAAVNPILQGALTIGASSARIALSETAVPEFDKDIRRQYGQGETAETYQALDGQRMEAILASTLEPLLVTDHQNQLLLANPAAQKLLEKTNEELIGKPVAQIIEHETLRKILTSEEGDTTPKPTEITFPNNQIYFVTASPVKVEGKKMGRVCLLRNITHYKELDAMKSEFVDTVNHDLRAPLTTMRGYATMLDMVGDLNEQQSRYVKKIVQGVENMSRLVNSLLDLGRIEAGVGLKLELLPFTDIVRQVSEALRVEAIQKQIDFQVHLPEETMPVVQADQALLERAIQNLIDNAIKFTPPQGKVEIDLYQDGENSIVLKVKDTGVGISPVDMPRLFERFYRGANRAAQNEKGSGLGLAIVKSIIERHHGTVSADSLLGKGSVFTITLPIRQPEN